VRPLEKNKRAEPEKRPAVKQLLFGCSITITQVVRKVSFREELKVKTRSRIPETTFLKAGGKGRSDQHQHACVNKDILNISYTTNNAVAGHLSSRANTG